MRRLTLIRHSTPEIRFEVPAAQWLLSADGLARARAFAAYVNPGTADRVVTSVEPKALQTAQALAEVWRLPVEEVTGLHEHERPAVRLMSRDEFEASVRDMFARPAELVFGAETADAAGARFTNAVRTLVERTDRDVMVVSHGTVIALFAAAHTGLDAYSFWMQQRMPCAVTFTLPEMALERVIQPE